MYGEGISKLGELVDLGAEFKIVQKSGAWYYMGETRLGQGRDAAKQYFKDNPEIAEDVERQIKEALATRNAESAGKGGKSAPAPEEEKPAPAPRSAPAKAGVEVFADDFEDEKED